MGTYNFSYITIMQDLVSHATDTPSIHYQNAGFDPYYIQRFCRAADRNMTWVPNNMPVILPSEMTDLYRGVFKFENMMDYNVPIHQSSIYAFKTLPDALQGFAANSCTATTHVLKDVVFKPEDKAPCMSGDPAEKTGSIYVLGQAHMMHDIEIFARAEAADQTIRKDEIRTHVPTQLSTALHNKKSNRDKTCGWYDIRNQFMLFTCKELFIETAYAFGIEIPYEQLKQEKPANPHI